MQIQLLMFKIYVLYYDKGYTRARKLINIAQADIVNDIRCIRLNCSQKDTVTQRMITRSKILV